MIDWEKFFGFILVAICGIGVAAGLFAFVGNIYLDRPGHAAISISLALVNCFGVGISWSFVRGW